MTGRSISVAKSVGNNSSSLPVLPDTCHPSDSRRHSPDSCPEISRVLSAWNSHFIFANWGFAIHELCGLVYEPILLHLASHFTRPGLGYGWAPPSFHEPREEMVRKAIADVQRQQVANHYRGRRHNGFFVPSARVRARSAPALPHCHRVVGLPQMSHAALPFREYYDDLDYFDDVDDFEDVDEVLFQQQIQAAEVDRLERRVRRLELEGR
jgi:hypothetical protein